MPESTHMAMWALSDRAIPRSYRMMEGFGVHSFVLVNEKGERRFVKFHWKPKLGTKGLVWDESQKLGTFLAYYGQILTYLCSGGQDPDFHRRDLYDAIQDGNFPEWELGLQIVEEKDEHSFDFDILVRWFDFITSTNSDFRTQQRLSLKNLYQFVSWVK